MIEKNNQLILYLGMMQMTTQNGCPKKLERNIDYLVRLNGNTLPLQAENQHSGGVMMKHLTARTVSLAKQILILVSQQK